MNKKNAISYDVIKMRWMFSQDCLSVNQFFKYLDDFLADENSLFRINLKLLMKLFIV